MNKILQGMVFDIQRFCLQDGPGIRTTVFLKGCALRCHWCSNPESQSHIIELMINQDRCIRCESCIHACHTQALSIDDSGIKVKRELCDLCGACERVCPRSAIIQKGQVWSVEKLISELKRDQQVFLSTEGGITFSGGEPLLQIDFLVNALAACKREGFNTAIETTLYSPWEQIEQCIALVDHFICDLKHTNPETHLKWTGISCELILENIRRIINTHPSVLVRIPVIPGMNTDQTSIEGLVQFALESQLKQVELLPYHILGEGKYALLGRLYPGTKIDASSAMKCVLEMKEHLVSKGVSVIIGG